SEHRRSYGRSVRPRSSATRRGYFSLENQHFIVEVDPALIGNCVDRLRVGNIEHAFDGRLVGTRADEIGASPLSEEKSERADNDRFSRACLTRENVEAGRKRKRQRFDDRKIPYSKLGQH